MDLDKETWTSSHQWTRFLCPRVCFGADTWRVPSLWFGWDVHVLKQRQTWDHTNTSTQTLLELPWFLHAIFMHLAHSAQTQTNLTKLFYLNTQTCTLTHTPKLDLARLCSLLEVCLAQHWAPLPVTLQAQTSGSPAPNLNLQFLTHTPPAFPCRCHFASLLLFMCEEYFA